MSLEEKTEKMYICLKRIMVGKHFQSHCINFSKTITVLQQFYAGRILLVVYLKVVYLTVNHIIIRIKMCIIKECSTDVQ